MVPDTVLVSVSRSRPSHWLSSVPLSFATRTLAPFCSSPPFVHAQHPDTASLSLTSNMLPMQTSISLEQQWTTAEIPGKGRGLVATTSISKGMRILSERLIVRLPWEDQGRRTDSKPAGDGLPPSVDEQLCNLTWSPSLDGHIHESRRTTIADTYGIPIDSVGNLGVFTNASSINHSWRPNAWHAWNTATERLTVHAIRNIEQGEEITISYLGTNTLVYSERRNRLSR